MSEVKKLLELEEVINEPIPLLDEISFDAPDLEEKTVVIDSHYVKEKLEDILEDENLSRYIL